MRKVLLSTDFSENANHAIEYALMLFDRDPVEYCLLNSYSLLHNLPETLISLEDILHEQSEIGLGQSRDRIIKSHDKINIETLSVYGDPPKAIMKIADDRQVDLVVLGSKGRTINDAVYGNTTIQLVRHINRPILIVPFDYQPKIPRHIVLTTDMVQMENLDALNPMLEIAHKYQADVIIINVTGDKEYHRVKQAMRRLQFNSHFNGIRSRFEIVDNKDIVAGIDEFVFEQQADLLVLSPKRYPYFKNMFHRSITKSVIKHSHIPVIVV